MHSTHMRTAYSTPGCLYGCDAHGSVPWNAQEREGEKEGEEPVFGLTDLQGHLSRTILQREPDCFLR